MIAYPETLDGKPPRPRRRWTRFVERYLPMIVIYLMVATLVGFVIIPSMVVTVPSGHVGLLWKRFRGGTQIDPAWLKKEGLRIILPWDKVFLYDLRLQTTTDTYNAISKDGVNLGATINIRFRLKQEAIPQLHQGIGPDYIARLVRPEISNRMREIIAEYSAEEVYSSKRQEIQRRIRTHTQAMLGQSMMERTESESEYGEAYRVSLDTMINLYDTLILGLELPQTVVSAINRKIEQYYLVQEYAFRVERERKESERKQIEAQGISAFQQTVSQGISDSYLRWRGIEATLQLAQSNNTKIVIVGNGKDSLPIILGNSDSPSTPPNSGASPLADRAAAPDAQTAVNAPPSANTLPFVNVSPSATAPPSANTPAAPTPAAPTPGRKPDGEAAQGEQRSSWLRSLSAIESFLSNALRPGERSVVPPLERPPEKRDAPAPR